MPPDTAETVTPEAPANDTAEEGAKPAAPVEKPAEATPPAAPEVPKETAASRLKAKLSASEREGREKRIAKERDAKYAKDAEELAGYRAWEDKLRKSPVAALRERKIDPTDHLESVVNEGKPEDPLAKTAKELADLKAQLAAKEAADAKAREDWQQTQHDQHIEKEFAKLGDFVYASPKEFPFSNYEYSKEKIAKIGRETSRRLSEAGHDHTGQELAAYIEELAKKKYAERKSRPSPLDGSNESDESQQAVSGNGPQASRPQSRTLKNSDGTTKATPNRPMTDEEIDEWALAELRALRKPKR